MATILVSNERDGDADSLFSQMTVYSQMIIPNQNQMLNVGIAGGASKLPQLPPQGGARGAQGQSEGQSELKMETERSTVLLDSS